MLSKQTIQQAQPAGINHNVDEMPQTHHIKHFTKENAVKQDEKAQAEFHMGLELITARAQLGSEHCLTLLTLSIHLLLTPASGSGKPLH